MEASAIGQDKQAIRRDEFSGLANPFRYESGRLDLMILDVDHTDADFKTPGKLLEQVEVFAAPARKLERKLVYLCFENCREQVPVVSRPGGLAVAVSVADVQGDSRIHALDERIDHLDTPRQIFRETGIVRFVDLKVFGACADQLLQLEIHDSSDVGSELFLTLVVLVANALHQRMRARHAELRHAAGIARKKLKVRGEAEAGHRHFSADDAVVEIVVELLRTAVDLDAGESLGKIVYEVVTPEFAVCDDVHTGHFLVLDGGFNGRIVDFVEFQAADAPENVLGLQPFQPSRHRITSDN